MSVRLRPASPAFNSLAQASEDNSRLMIVDRDQGRMVYDDLASETVPLMVNQGWSRVWDWFVDDDGHDDLFCTTRTVVVGYTYSGQPLYDLILRCR